MQRLLIPLTFIQSFATVLLERGLYFYTDDQLGFSELENLGLALLFGGCYAGGALSSHAITKRRGERPALQAVLMGLGALSLTVAVMPGRVVVWSGFAGIAFLIGVKWPIIESYVTAGATPDRAFRVLGRFNVAWSSAMPLSLATTGFMIDSVSPTSFVVLAAVIYLGTIPFLRGLPWVPVHLPHDHPARPDPVRLRRYRALLVSSRWSMVGTCAMMFLLAPLMPSIFADLGHGVAWSPALSSVVDACRFLAFAVLGGWAAWRGRSLPLVVSAFLIPIGFLLVLFATTTTSAILGQVLFGFCAGQVYYAAIYHAMVLHNASVEAGGHHESMIGAGFALGPAIGLAGVLLQRVTGDPTTAMLLAVMPFVALCVFASLWPLWGLWRHARAVSGQPPEKVLESLVTDPLHQSEPTEATP
ncbi:MAG: hypothetical protein AAF333_07835 [Planctomycetota bacterium]